MDENNKPQQQTTPSADTSSTSSRKQKKSLIFSASALICIALALVFYLIGNLPAFSSFFGKVIDLFKPLLWGALIAYLCNPILSFYERHLLKRMSSFHAKRMLGIVLTYLFVILLIAIFGLVLVPSLVESIQTLVSEFENYIANAVTYVNNLIVSISAHLPEGVIEETGDLLSVETIISAVEALISRAGGLFDGLFENIATYASRLISGITDVVLALFISFYLLASKELRGAQIKKIMNAFCSEKVCKFAMSTAKMVNSTFGHYFGGVTLDALIIGIVGFIVFSILNIPFPLMIAFIVAVTNIIPVFGPFLGAVPSAFIIFITAPEKTIPFIIAILVMQQVDGNIIAPKILGQSTGISSLCVIVSLAVMGGLFGILGMVIGVPIFAVVVTLIRQAAEAKLAHKGLPCDIESYFYDEAEPESHAKQSNIWHRTFTKAAHALRRPIGYLRYGVAYLYFRILGKKRKLTAPRLADYLPETPQTASPDAVDTDTGADDTASAAVDAEGAEQ